MIPLDKAKKEYKSDIRWCVFSGIISILLWKVQKDTVGATIWSLLFLYEFANAIVAWKAINDIQEKKNTLAAKVFIYPGPPREPTPLYRFRRHRRQQKLIDGFTVSRAEIATLAVSYLGPHTFRMVCLSPDCTHFDKNTNAPYEEGLQHVQESGKQHDFRLVPAQDMETFLETYAGQAKEGN